MVILLFRGVSQLCGIGKPELSLKLLMLPSAQGISREEPDTVYQDLLTVRKTASSLNQASTASPELC